MIVNKTSLVTTRQVEGSVVKSLLTEIYRPTGVSAGRSFVLTTKNVSYCQPRYTLDLQHMSAFRTSVGIFSLCRFRQNTPREGPKHANQEKSKMI